MSKLRYLHHPASQPCRSAFQFMVENDIPVEDEIVDITTDINETQGDDPIDLTFTIKVTDGDGDSASVDAVFVIGDEGRIGLASLHVPQDDFSFERAAGGCQGRWVAPRAAAS